MKMTTKIGDKEFSWATPQELAEKLEKELKELETKMTEYAQIQKRYHQIKVALLQIKGIANQTNKQ